jgi:hypothetical protein
MHLYLEKEKILKRYSHNSGLVKKRKKFDENCQA